jgi:ADP-sugar diphosphatase
MDDSNINKINDSEGVVRSSSLRSSSAALKVSSEPPASLLATPTPPLESPASPAPSSTDTPSRLLLLQKRDIPLTWAPHIDNAAIDKVLQFGPFIDWMHAINQIEIHDVTKPELIIDKVHIQQLDMFGPRIGFIKFEASARKWNEKMQQIGFVPGIVFLRGGAVGILCILIEQETGNEFALITLQPRVPVGISSFPEIPAGMLDGEPNHQKFAGKAAKEMSEETLLEITDGELFDLTHFAYEGKYKGMYPSAGGCDEFLRLFLYRRYMSKEVLELLRMAHTGDDETEIIKLKLVPLAELWHEAPDAKALAALYLYTKFQEAKKHHPPSALDTKQEDQLKALLKPKLQHKLSKGASMLQVQHFVNQFQNIIEPMKTEIIEKKEERVEDVPIISKDPDVKASSSPAGKAKKKQKKKQEKKKPYDKKKKGV